MSDQTKCPNGGCDVCALGGDCRTYGVPAPTPPGLDFKAAQRESARLNSSPDFFEWDSMSAEYEVHLNAQLHARIAAAEAKYQPLVQLVREWQEASVAVREIRMLEGAEHPNTIRYVNAANALAAWKGPNE